MLDADKMRATMLLVSIVKPNVTRRGKEGFKCSIFALRNPQDQE